MGVSRGRLGVPGSAANGARASQGNVPARVPCKASHGDDVPSADAANEVPALHDSSWHEEAKPRSVHTAVDPYHGNRGQQHQTTRPGAVPDRLGPAEVLGAQSASGMPPCCEHSNESWNGRVYEGEGVEEEACDASGARAGRQQI